MNERKWIDIEPGESSFSAYEISKKVINLLRHSQTVQREDDGAVQFWRIKNYLQNQFPQTTYWSDDRWKACLAAGGAAKKRYQYFDTMARRKFIEDQKTILELSGRVQELQDEVFCMIDSKDFHDAESVRSGNSHVTSRPVSFPPHPIPEGMLRPSFISPLRKEGPPCIWDTHGKSGNVFVIPDASSSAPCPQELHQWNLSIEEPLHSTTVEKSERPKQNQDLRCQSGPSAKDSVILSGRDSLKNYGADQQRLQILDLHFGKFPTPATFACWKIRFKTEVCICSQFPTESMQWIKEVEMVDSVDDLNLRHQYGLFQCKIL